MIYVVGFIGLLLAGVIGWIAFRLRQERKRGQQEARDAADRAALERAKEADRIEDEINSKTEEEIDAMLERDAPNSPSRVHDTPKK